MSSNLKLDITFLMPQLPMNCSLSQSLFIVGSLIINIMQLIPRNALISSLLVWSSLPIFWAYNLLSSARSLTSPSRLVAAKKTTKKDTLFQKLMDNVSFLGWSIFFPKSNSISPRLYSFFFAFSLAFCFPFSLVFLSLFLCFFLFLPSQLQYFFLQRFFQQFNLN